VTNFTSAFPKLGYLGIKKSLTATMSTTPKRTIVQASLLKSQLEELDIRKDDVTLASVDADAMCPSIKCKLVKQVVDHCSRNLDDNKRTINVCLQMIKFGMGATLISFSGNLQKL